jgi:hypothetical protein
MDFALRHSFYLHPYHDLNTAVNFLPGPVPNCWIDLHLGVYMGPFSGPYFPIFLPSVPRLAVEVEHGLRDVSHSLISTNTALLIDR